MWVARFLVCKWLSDWENCRKSATLSVIKRRISKKKFNAFDNKFPIKWGRCGIVISPRYNGLIKKNWLLYSIILILSRISRVLSTARNFCGIWPPMVPSTKQNGRGGGKRGDDSMLVEMHHGRQMVSRFANSQLLSIASCGRNAIRWVRRTGRAHSIWVTECDLITQRVVLCKWHVTQPWVIAQMQFTERPFRERELTLPHVCRSERHRGERRRPIYDYIFRRVRNTTAVNTSYFSLPRAVYRFSEKFFQNVQRWRKG